MGGQVFQKGHEIGKGAESVLSHINDSDNDHMADFVTFEELFPEFHVGNALRGARNREGLTQVQLAAMIGIQPTHVSAMERGKRSIGKEMAKRLGKALRIGYKVFL
jgi:ribosome-binding protein aMBF1 (putative translation factor)